MSTATGGARLACALDAGEWLPCTSPAAYSGLAVGTHRFRVRAVSEAGVSSPATATWTVAAATQSLIDGLQATPFTTRSAITLRLAAPADASLVIFDAAGHPVRRLFVGRALPAGVTTVSWYGYCDPPSAVRLPPGSYRVRLTAVAAGSMQISRTAITIPTLSGAVRRA
jgi:hypothetical protein